MGKAHSRQDNWDANCWAGLNKDNELDDACDQPMMSARPSRACVDTCLGT